MQIYMYTIYALIAIFFCECVEMRNTMIMLLDSINLNHAKDLEAHYKGTS